MLNPDGGGALVVEMVFELLAWRRGMANRARIDGASMPLKLDRLDVVLSGHRWTHGVRATVACGAVDVAMAMRLFEELPGLLKIELGLSGLMASSALGLVNPRNAGRIADGGHVAVTGHAIDALGKVHVALAIGLETRMACVALVIEPHIEDGLHAIGMGAVHGRRH